VIFSALEARRRKTVRFRDAYLHNPPHAVSTGPITQFSSVYPNYRQHGAAPHGGIHLLRDRRGGIDQSTTLAYRGEGGLLDGRIVTVEIIPEYYS